MSYNRVEETLYAIERNLRQKDGIDAAERYMAPLAWYIKTGRASLPFIKKLCNAKPFVVARVLRKGGSYDEIISALKKKLRFQFEEAGCLKEADIYA